MTVYPGSYQLGTLGSEVLMSANDADLQQTVKNIAKDQWLLSGNLVRDKIAQRFTWAWHYSWIPGKKRDVYDGGMGRNDLLALYQADAAMSFLVPNDQGAQLAYTVRFVLDSWTEKCVWHPQGSDYYSWDLSFALIQTL